MKLSVATNFQGDLIPRIARIKRNSIIELYGKLSSDFVGGGRGSYLLPGVTKGKVERYVEEAHQNGIKFNYLLNAACLDNKEFTMQGQKKLRQLLDWLVDIKVDLVTVAIPYLLEFIKMRHPQLKVCISLYAGVDTIEKLKYWENLGADIIILSPNINRKIRLLKDIVKCKKCEIELIANFACLYDCPYRFYHSVFQSHASQGGHVLHGFAIDYCILSCSYARINNPTEIIRSPWIRPEDIDYYKDIGIDRFKLIDRTKSAEKTLSIVNAYTNKYYEGNLVDLLPNFHAIGQAKVSLFHKIKFFFHPFSVNIFRLKRMKGLLSEFKFYIDNRKLDGFLKHFIDKDCSLVTCQDCGYCEKIAKEIVMIEPGYQNRTLNKLKRAKDELVSGRLYRYFL